MSYSEVSEDVREVANRVLTGKQLDVWVLMLAGCSQRRSALMLGLSRSTVRSHLEEAHMRLISAGVRWSVEGVYYLEVVSG